MIKGNMSSRDEPKVENILSELTAGIDPHPVDFEAADLVNSL
jgi:hypothetical protein